MYAHGHFQIWTDQDVLLAKAKGQWNLEMAKQYADAFQQIANSMPNHPWGHIVYLDDWELGTPDIEPIIVELVGWAIENGLTRSAQVYSPSMLKKYQLDRMIAESLGPFERRTFRDEPTAFEWLRSEGFGVSDERLLLKTA